MSPAVPLEGLRRGDRPRRPSAGWRARASPLKRRGGVSRRTWTNRRVRTGGGVGPHAAGAQCLSGSAVVLPASAATDPARPTAAWSSPPRLGTRCGAQGPRIRSESSDGHHPSLRRRCSGSQDEGGDPCSAHNAGPTIHIRASTRTGPIFQTAPSVGAHLHPPAQHFASIGITFLRSQYYPVIIQ